MKRFTSIVFLTLIIASILFPKTGTCEIVFPQDLNRECNEAQTNTNELVIAEAGEKDRDKGDVGVKDLSDRILRIEEKIDSKNLRTWSDKINLNGVIEVEAGYEGFDFNAPSEDDEKSTDISVATVELGVDVDIVKHVKGYILLEYEDDEDVSVDEAIITIDGLDVLPFYLNVGKLCIPFGYYESHFISDPLTIELGETKESAVVAGFSGGMFGLSLGVFNGDINKTDKDDHIKNFVASAVFTPPEVAVTGLGLMVGASWISNIADSNGLQDYLGEEYGVNEIDHYIPGWSIFLSASFLDRFFLEYEYVAASEKFENDDLGLSPGEEFGPKAWNLDFAFAITEDLEAAIRYERSNDSHGFIPERQYGAAVTCGLFEKTSLAVEYLHGAFENNDERDVLTVQIAIEF